MMSVKLANPGDGDERLSQESPARHIRLVSVPGRAPTSDCWIDAGQETAFASEMEQKEPSRSRGTRCRLLFHFARGEDLPVRHVGDRLLHALQEAVRLVVRKPGWRQLEPTRQTLESQTSAHNPAEAGTVPTLNLVEQYYLPYGGEVCVYELRPSDRPPVSSADTVQLR